MMAACVWLGTSALELLALYRVSMVVFCSLNAWLKEER